MQHSSAIVICPSRFRPLGHHLGDHYIVFKLPLVVKHKTKLNKRADYSIYKVFSIAIVVINENTYGV
jgi:hypothetical protein